MHISVQSVVRAAFGILAVAAGTLLVYHLRDKILLLFLATFIAAVKNPSVA